MQEGVVCVMTIDWGNGARFPYAQAVANVRLVGREIAILVKEMQSLLGVNPDRIHIIGFSLGAHIAGTVGRLLDCQLGRITGQYLISSTVYTNDGMSITCVH